MQDEFLEARTGACVQCSFCAAGLVTARRCSASADTVCAAAAGAGESFHDTSEHQAQSEAMGAGTLPPTAMPPAQEEGRSAKKRPAQPVGSIVSEVPDDTPVLALTSISEDVPTRPTHTSRGPTSRGPRAPPVAFPEVMTKEWVELDWEAACYHKDNIDVLVALPYNRNMQAELTQEMFLQVKQMECASEGFNLHLALYDEPFDNSMDAKKTKGESPPPPKGGCGGEPRTVSLRQPPEP